MSFPDLFSANAELYASARPRYPDSLFAAIAERAPALDAVWDCGTGNGQAAVALSAHFRRVEASDASAAQIAQAQAHPRVRYSVQTAEQTGYPDAAFDAVCVAQALHWFEFPRFFAEVTRVLRPGGLFVAWGYNWSTVTPAFDAALDRHIKSVIREDWAPQNRLLWNGYRDVSMPFAPQPFPPQTIELHWNLRQVLAYVQTWSAVQRAVARQGAAFLHAAEPELRAAWGDPAQIRVVKMPLELLAGRR